MKKAILEMKYLWQLHLTFLLFVALNLSPVAIGAQTLVIEYYDRDYGRKKQFFSLDKSDITSLIDQLQRTLVKLDTVGESIKLLGKKDLT